MKSRRLTEMEGYILSHGSVPMEELRDVFKISMNTARRDITELVQGGRVEKVYGGVKAIEQVQPLVPYAVRSSSPSRAKQAICRIAGEMVRDGDIILMHDVHQETADAAERIIPALLERGYQLVTVSELAAARGKSLEPGASYREFWK